jgi:hypothetical protein
MPNPGLLLADVVEDKFSPLKIGSGNASSWAEIALPVFILSGAGGLRPR